jgi:hypothetical protein
MGIGVRNINYRYCRAMLLQANKKIIKEEDGV